MHNPVIGLEDEINCDCPECVFCNKMNAASKAARARVEQDHFSRTGEKKPAGQILMGVIDRVLNYEFRQTLSQPKGQKGTL